MTETNIWQDMQLNWKLLSNKQKTLRTIFIGAVVIAACSFWYESIIQWPRGRGQAVIVVCFLGFPIQALYYGLKWYRERSTQN